MSDHRNTLASVRDRLQLENLVALHENTVEAAFRSGGDLTVARANLAFSKLQLARFVAENE